MQLGIGLHGVAVEHLGTDVHPFGRQRHIVAVGSRAHGKEEASTHHKIAYLLGHSQFQMAHLAVAQLGGHSLL